jgi:hypothetical protein
MRSYKVYCSYHNLEGTCSIEDYQDTKAGVNPSGMLRVTFPAFTQAVPFHTIKLEFASSNISSTLNGDMANEFNNTHY